jgi:radical SAM-linked protein
VIFRKGEGARYLSHLDLMATLEFSIRRAELPVALSEGFNRRPRMSLVLPLILGHTGEREILEITLRERREPSEIHHRLQASVPPGITILDVLEVSAEGKSAAARVRSATYRIDLPGPIPDLSDRADTLLRSDAVAMKEERKGETRGRDVRSLILALEPLDARTLRLQLAATNEGGLRPEQVLDLLGLPREGASVSREAIELA